MLYQFHGRGKKKITFGIILDIKFGVLTRIKMLIPLAINEKLM
jgi:hypothetical protein